MTEYSEIEQPERGARLFRWMLFGLIPFVLITLVLLGLLVARLVQKQRAYNAFQDEVAQNYALWRDSNTFQYTLLFSHNSSSIYCKDATMTVKGAVLNSDNEDAVSIDSSCSVGVRTRYGDPRWSAMSIDALFMWLQDEGASYGVKDIIIYTIEYDPEWGYVRHLEIASQHSPDRRFTIEYHTLRRNGRTL